MFIRVRIPAHAEMNVIRPNMQLSGGLAPVSLKKTTKLHLEKFLLHVSLQFDRFQTFIYDVLSFMMFDFTGMGKSSEAARIFYYSIRATGVRAAAKLKRRKTKLNFDRALLFTNNR